VFFCLFSFFKFSLIVILFVGKEKESGLGLGITQFRLQCIITLLCFFFFFFLLCFGCPAIVAVLVIVGRDMGKGVGEESVVAKDIAAEVFDERFE
jgi:hypothetical protein